MAFTEPKEASIRALWETFPGLCGADAQMEKTRSFGVCDSRFAQFSVCLKVARNFLLCTCCAHNPTPKTGWKHEHVPVDCRGSGRTP